MTAPEMTPEQADAAELANWNDLGRKYLEAYKRDSALGLPVLSLPQLSGALERHLSAWLDGHANQFRASTEQAASAMGGRISRTEWSERHEAERLVRMDDRLKIASENYRWDGQRETLWVLTPCGGGKFGAAKLAFRGSPTRTSYVSHDFPPTGPFLVAHVHPNADLTPSDNDLNCAAHIAMRWPEAAFGIMDPACSKLYLVREGPIRALTPDGQLTALSHEAEDNAAGFVPVATP
jgi:hypothetical protein